MEQISHPSKKAGRGSRYIVALGFAAMLLLLLALGLGWVVSVQHATRHLHMLADQYENAMQVVTMRDAAQGRMLALDRMALSPDPFQRDQEFLDFNAKAADFIRARDAMLNAGLRPDEQAVWFQARNLVRLNADAESAAADLIKNGDQHYALGVISQEVTARQKAIHASLTEQQQLMQKHVRSELESASREGLLAERTALGLGLAAIVLGAMVMWLVLVRSTSAERALVAAREEAQRANHFKSLFLANMSHEIRTPLTAVIGFAETLIHDRQSRKLRQEAAQLIYNSGNHLMSIVNDILDLSKIEAGQMLVEKVDFAPHAVVQSVLQQWRPHAEAKGIRLEANYDFPLPASIQSDPLRFQQILSNLVSNAVKFTDEGQVLVSLRHDRERKQILVAVADSGIGMSEAELRRIFAPFEQADASTTRKYGGTGLGLAIALNLAHLLEGELHCASVKGQGTHFTLTLPVNISDASNWIESEGQMEASALPVPAHAASVPRLIGHILLAEDTIENQQLIVRYVKRTGASIVTVEDGRKAIERMDREDFDLILLDVQMPMLGGVEAAIELRSKGYKQPIIAITANVLAEDVERYAQAGMTDVIEKPFNSAKFYAVISNYLPHASSPSMAADYSDMADIREGFIARLPEITQKLRQSLPNWPVLQSETHQLKGLGGSLGFPEISLAAKEALESMRSDDYELALERVEHLLSILVSIQESLSRQPPGPSV